MYYIVLTASCPNPRFAAFCLMVFQERFLPSEKVHDNARSLLHLISEFLFELHFQLKLSYPIHCANPYKNSFTVSLTYF